VTAGLRSVLALAWAITAAGALARGQTQPAQTFRTRTDVVHVDVSVTDGGRAVTDLGPRDFVLTDNGVRQRIDSVDATEVPIDVTLVLDVSGDAGRSWRSSPPPARTAAAIQTEAAGVARILRPADRLRALAVDTRVQQLWPMRAARSLPPLPSVESGGMAALYDALTAALLYPVEPARRHVVIARTKGIDNISSLDALAVRAIVGRSDALLHIVSMETALDNEEALTGFQCRLMGYCWPTRRFWTPYQRRLIGGVSTLLPDGQAIAGAAEATGGGLHRASLFEVPTLTGIFKRTFDDFRTGYVLRYTPQGVPQGGWHEIEVKVARSRPARIRARTGYFVEADAPAPKPAAVPERPRTLPEFITTYEHGGWRQLTLGLREVTDPVRLLREFEDGGNPWPAAPRKEAAFALELVEPAVFSSRAAARDAARALLERFRRLVRHPLEPDVFERYWYFAALTMLEGSIRPAVTEAFANLALARFSRRAAIPPLARDRDRSALGRPCER
jgi:VWFA-related protein